MKWECGTLDGCVTCVHHHVHPQIVRSLECFAADLATLFRRLEIMLLLVNGHVTTVRIWNAAFVTLHCVWSFVLAQVTPPIVLDAECALTVLANRGRLRMDLHVHT